MIGRWHHRRDRESGEGDYPDANAVKIRIVWGSSEGSTEVSAFDSALCEAGIHNLNLIEMSSVIPPRAEVIEIGRIRLEEPVGSIGKVVLSHIEGMNCWIASGLGWAIAEEGGIFVEGALEGRSKHCEKEIIKGLEDVMGNRAWNWKTKPVIRVLETRAKAGSFSSAVVAALYSIEPLRV